MNNFKTIEILRDIHDKTDCPIVFVGMGLAHRKLERYNQFSSDLYSIGAKLRNKANDDLDTKRELNKHSINVIEEIVKIVTKNEKELFLNKKDSKEQIPPSDGLSQKLIQRINREFLGIENN